MRPELGPESPRKRASFSKATRGCPASRAKFSRAFADRANGEKPLDFSGFRRCSGWARRSGASEPFGTALGPPTVPVIAISAVAVVPVRVALPAHFAVVVPPASPAAEPAVHTGQHGKPALLAVIEGLVERVGGFRGLLHGPRRARHPRGPGPQPRPGIRRLRRPGIVPRRVPAGGGGIHP